MDEQKPSTPQTGQVLAAIQYLLITLQKHEKGHDFYIEAAFKELEIIFPETVPLEDFRTLVSQCKSAKMCGYQKELTIETEKVFSSPIKRMEPFVDFTKDARKRALKELRHLGEQAEDILGTATFNLVKRTA